MYAENKMCMLIRNYLYNDHHSALVISCVDDAYTSTPSWQCRFVFIRHIYLAAYQL